MQRYDVNQIIIIVVIFSLSITMESTFAQTTTPQYVFVHLDKNSYATGDTITVSGSVGTVVAGQPLTIQIVAPGSGASIGYGPVNINNDSTFSYSLSTTDFFGTSGVYTVVVYYGKQQAQTTFQFFNALPYTPERTSTGIVADGKIHRDNGSSYEVNANAIIGYVHVDSIGVDPPNSGASLQLNAVLHVTTTNGTKDYWLQNALQFHNTNYQSANIINNIWKQSGPNDPLKVCVKIPFTLHYACKKVEFYYQSAGNFVYHLPFSETITITERLIPEKGILVQFTYTGNGFTHVYDQHLMAIPNVTSASFLISGNQEPDYLLSYDAEFVWAGQSDYETANFRSMDSILGLFYTNSNLGAWKPFPDYSSYGHDTGEMAQNIHSEILKDYSGIAFIK